MTVIEHWLIRDTAGVKLQATVHADVADAYRRQGCTVEGPFVPAEQLRGAVEALRAIAKVDHVDAVLDPNRPLRIAKAWLRKHDRAPASRENGETNASAALARA